jgi:PAS domain-containing protein
VLLPFVLASLWQHGWDRLVVRGLSFGVGGMIALLHARSRERAERLIGQLRQIVERAPAVLVTADGMGCILSASEELRELVGPEFAPLEGHSFSDVLMGQLPPGEAMRRYIEWFRREGTHPQEFSLRGHAETRFRGRVVCTGEGRDRLLIATLARPAENGMSGGVA